MHGRSRRTHGEPRSWLRPSTPGVGRRTGMIGALLVGAREDSGQLVYLCHVGTGFTEAALRRLQGQLAGLERLVSAVRVPVPREHACGAHWVSRYWSATWSTASSPPANGGCGTPPGKDCGPTSRH